MTAVDFFRLQGGFQLTGTALFFFLIFLLPSRSTTRSFSIGLQGVFPSDYKEFFHLQGLFPSRISIFYKEFYLLSLLQGFFHNFSLLLFEFYLFTYYLLFAGPWTNWWKFLLSQNLHLNLWWPLYGIALILLKQLFIFCLLIIFDRFNFCSHNFCRHAWHKEV